MKCLVTGASGFVAGGVLKQAPADWEMIALSRGEPLLYRPGLAWRRLEDNAPGRLAAAIHAARPDAVIHTIAIPDIDYCQAHQDEAKRVNVDMAREVAEACAELGAKCVHCSTDNVFNGKRSMYREDDPVGPVNFYGETKLRAEEAVRPVGGRIVVARVAIVLGLPLSGGHSTSLLRLVNDLKLGKPSGTPGFEIRTPVDVASLGLALLELAGNTFTGTIHLSGCERGNRVDFMRQIAERLGYDPTLVVPNNPELLPGRAPRPIDVSLDNTLARKVLHTELPGIQGGLERILALAAAL